MLTIELLADGGIRLTPPGAPTGLASRRLVREWMDDATRERYPMHVTGEIDAHLVADVADELRRAGAEVTIERSTPEQWPHGWSSLQLAAYNGLEEVVTDLIDRGVLTKARRPRLPGRRVSSDHSPYRLAMRRGHFGVLRILRDAGVRAPSGSRPPEDLPDAVVVRQYLPASIRWLAIVAVVASLVLTVVVWHWAFLIVAAFSVAVVLVADWAIGRTRVAVDGQAIAVRPLLRWHQPFDLEQLVALDYAPAIARRLPAAWRFVQRQAGPRFRPGGGFDQSQVERLKAHGDLRVATIYSARDFLSPGIERHLARHVASPPTLISTNAQSMLQGAPTR